MSATWPVEVALVEVLLLSAALRAMLGERDAVFSDGMVPKNYAYSFVVVGDNTEDHADTFTRRGYATTHSLHIWAPDKAEAQKIYAKLEEILHLQRIIVEDHIVVRGALTQPVSTYSAPDSAWHILARYDVQTQRQARK